MKKISVHAFQSLDNYGTGMMGLVTLSRLQKEIGGPVTFECDFFDRTDLSEVQSELGVGPETIRLVARKDDRRPWPKSRPARLKRVAEMLTDDSVRGYDMVIFLGGDDLSEYYDRAIWRHIMDLKRWGRNQPMILLGQTMGPFDRPINRMAARHVFKGSWIFPRDKWCTGYLSSDLGLSRRVFQSSDLAFADLPRQHETAIRDEVLAEYGLETDGYFTMVVSAMQAAGYYTRDTAAYLDGWKQIGERLLRSERLAGKKLCLLAHTHSSHYGDEPTYIEQLLPLFDPELRDRIVPVTRRVLQTRARFILGNGLFTVTGRMHPAVSTFQMGKPAIPLSYSKKYEGVMGTMLGRSDLIVEANDPAIWESREVVDRTIAKVDYTLDNYDRLKAEIRTAIDGQKAIIDDTFDRLGKVLKGSRQAMAA